MLVLSRKADDQIIIGDDICITIAKISGGRVRVAIDAPREIAIRRGELAERDDKVAGTRSREEELRTSDVLAPEALAPEALGKCGNSDVASLHVAAYHA